MRGAGRFHTRSKRPATPRGECDGRLLCSGPARHAHALVSQGDARTSARTPARTPARHAHALVSQGHARTTAQARVGTSRVGTSRARAAAAGSTRHVVLGHATPPPTKQRKRLADARAAGANGQPARGRHAQRCTPADARSAGRGSGLAALPQPSQCRPETGPANVSKSGRDGRRGAAAQHKHYGAVQGRDFRKGQLARIFRPKNINNATIHKYQKGK
jgi:hypothetical protein